MNEYQLKSSDGKLFPISKDALILSHLLSNLVQDIPVNEPIPLIDVDSTTTKILIEFMEQSMLPQETQWQQTFLKKYINLIPQLMIASQYLQIDCLTEQINLLIVSEINNCTDYHDMNAKLNITNDLSNEEIEAIDADLFHK